MSILRPVVATIFLLIAGLILTYFGYMAHDFWPSLTLMLGGLGLEIVAVIVIFRAYEAS